MSLDYVDIARCILVGPLAGTEQGLAFALQNTAYEGLCQSTYGGFTKTTPVLLNHMYANNITLRIGRVHARANMPSVIDLMHKGCVHPEQVGSREVPFSQAPEAMLEPALAMVFVPD